MHARWTRPDTGPTDRRRLTSEALSAVLPADRLPGLAAMAEEIDAATTTRVVIRFPLVHPASNAYGAVQIPDVPAIRTVASSLFPTPGTSPAPWPTPRPTKPPKATPSS